MCPCTAVARAISLRWFVRLALCSCAVALDPCGGRRSLAERAVEIRDFNWHRHRAREVADVEAVARAEAIKLERLGRLTGSGLDEGGGC